MSEIAESDKKGNAVVFWLARFWGLVGIFYFLDKNAWFQERLVAVYARCSTRLAGLGLTLIGVDCRVSDNAITAAGKNFLVAASCTGSFVFLIFAALVLTFPVSWKKRLGGLLLGFVSIAGLNLLRIMLIVLLGSRFPASFWGMHIIFGQALIIAGTLATFIWWARDETGPGRETLLPGRRRLGKLALLYVAGFLFSYGVYAFFLSSPAGEWLRGVIVRHAAGVLGLLTGGASWDGQVIHTARNSIRVIQNCLSSPVLVLFLAGFFLLPLSWPKRLLLFALSFLPLYYLYHLVRTVFLVLFLTGDRSVSFAYNFFGHLVLVPALLGLSAYYWCGIRRKRGCREQFLQLGIGLVIAGAVAGVVYCFWQGFGLEWLRAAVGVAGKFYDHGSLLRLMPAVHLLLWGSLVWSTPGWSPARRLFWLAGGVVVLSLFYAVLMAAIGLLCLHPHHWLLKLLNIGLPVLVYFLLVPGRVEPDSGEAEE